MSRTGDSAIGGQASALCSLAERLDYAVDPNRPRTANIVPLRTYVHTRYRLAKLFRDGDEVWERK
jgi:hypothetical protein